MCLIYTLVHLTSYTSPPPGRGLGEPDRRAPPRQHGLVARGGDARDMAAPCGLSTGGAPLALYLQLHPSASAALSQVHPSATLLSLSCPPCLPLQVHRSVFGKKHCMVVSGAASSEAAVLQCVTYLSPLSITPRLLRSPEAAVLQCAAAATSP